MSSYRVVENRVRWWKTRDLEEGLVEVKPVVEEVPVGKGVVELETRPKVMPREGKVWQCLDCGALLRLNGHHQGPRHGVVFVNGQPQYYRD